MCFSDGLWVRLDLNVWGLVCYLIKIFMLCFHQPPGLLNSLLKSPTSISQHSLVFGCVFLFASTFIDCSVTLPGDNYAMLLYPSITESLSFILSSTISLIWAVSYVGLKDGCPFPEPLLHPYPCLFCRQDKLWVDFCLFVCLGWCPIPPWKSCLPPGVGHFIFHIPSLSESQRVSPTLTHQDLFYPHLQVFPEITPHVDCSSYSQTFPALPVPTPVPIHYPSSHPVPSLHTSPVNI